MAALTHSTPDRIKAGIGTAVITGALGCVFVFGLAVHNPAALPDALKVFGVAPEPPPPPTRKQPHRIAEHRPQGASAPANLHAVATKIVQPKPIVPPLVKIPIVAAPIANVGAAATNGASNVRGPGTGGGGQGNGTGSGGAGSGDGAGDDTPPRQIKGSIKASDNHDWEDLPKSGGTVSVLYRVETNGRVSTCRVTHSSGVAALDALTCQLIQQRFRFEPSREPDGTPVSSQVAQDHFWGREDEPDDDR